MFTMNKKRLITAICVSWMVAQASAQVSLETVFSGPFSEPYGVAVDLATNDYFVTDSANHRIVKYDSVQDEFGNFAGLPGSAGSANGAGVSARFFNPQGIATATRGGVRGLVVSDSGNHTIRFISLNGAVTTIGGSAGVSGSEDGAGVDARFNSPTGLAAASDGTIYVADLLNNRIRVIAPDNSVTTLDPVLARPSDVTLDPVNNILYVADAGSNSIKRIDLNAGTPTAELIAGSASGVSGFRDSLVGTEAAFHNPRGIVYVNSIVGLLVSDTANDAIRRVYENTDLGSGIYTVERYADTPWEDLKSPMGLAVDALGNIPVVSLGTDSLVRVLLTEPQPRIANPVIGFVEFVENDLGQLISVLTPVVNSTFNNDVKILIQGESGTGGAHFNFGANANTVADPVPGVSLQAGDTYRNGLTPEQVADISSEIIIADEGPDFTIKALSAQTGRLPSEVVSARFRFQAANPVIIGDNPIDFSVANSTEGVVMYYTTDGSEPNEGSSVYAPGLALQFVGVSEVTFRIKAYKDGYFSSQTVQRVFNIQNLVTTQIGVLADYESGAGSTAVIPVEVTLAPDRRLRSLQFRFEVTPSAGAPDATDQLRLLPINATNDFAILNAPSTNAPNSSLYNLGNGVKGLAISYLGSTGMEITTSNVVAMVAVPIPPTAALGDTYTLSILNASGTEDGIQKALPITPFTSRTITVANKGYVVGDTAVSRWYNHLVGMNVLGDGDLNNNDVNNAFRASLGFNTPYSFSDIFDAMDAFPKDTATTVGGDGQIRFLDWQTILLRSLRLDSQNWTRTWVGGVRTVAASGLAGDPNFPAEEVGFSSDANFAATEDSGPAWNVQASIGGQVVENAGAGVSVSVPVYVNVKPGASLSGLQFRASVVGTLGAPQLTEEVQFQGASDLPAPILLQNDTTAIPLNQVAGAWAFEQNEFEIPLTGNQLLGHIQFVTPFGAPKGSAYQVQFANFDGAPDLDTQYEFESYSSMVWIGSPALTPISGLSDDWKLHFFNSLNNPLSGDDQDPDGDGETNMAEFLQGTNPVEFRLHQPELKKSVTDDFSLTLTWYADSNHSYVLEYQSGASGEWIEMETFAGTGSLIDFEVPAGLVGQELFRLRVVEGQD